MRAELGLVGVAAVLALIGLAQPRPEAQPASPAVPVADRSVLLDVPPAEVGLPLYPGASARARATLRRGAGWSMADAVLSTPDASGKVAAWYARQMPGARRVDSDGGVLLTRRAGTAHETVRIDPAGDATRIILQRRDEPGGR
ncbi:MAG: hypothetical protein HYU66_15340 [Armatimonadetes bacterium]|nr:hypothetical protein [Armatimonadota bacterium]